MNMIMRSDNLYYYSDDNNRLKKAKIRYVIYGSIILALSVAIFVFVYTITYPTTIVMEYFLSVSLVIDMIIGIIYIIRGALFKNKIKSNFFLNMVYAKRNGEEIKLNSGFIRYLSIAPVIFNITIIINYVSMLYYQDFKFMNLFSLILGVILFIACLMAMISLDSENLIYDKVD